METKYGFILMTVAEFDGWLKKLQINRVIKVIQNHHTFLPNYSNFNGNNHFEKLQGMRASHISRGFSDIAQNITTFPDGKLAIGRPLNVVPAGIYGQNSHGICIENLGDFDAGKDKMTSSQKDTIVQVNALLCNKYNLVPDSDSIIYHHWFDLRTGQRTNGSGNTKSCPGTAFFGGNTVSAAQQNFIPLILSAYNLLKRQSIGSDQNHTLGIVNSSGNLNIRKGPGTSFEKTGTIPSGATIRIYEQKGEWRRISPRNEWVSSRYVSVVQHGVINVDSAGVYAGPGGTFNLLNTLSNSDKVVIYASANGWSRIDFIDKWVKSQLITILD
jgi:hypothetical protein